MNNCGSMPHGRLDPRLLAHLHTTRCAEYSATPHPESRNDSEENVGEFDYSLAMVYSPKQAWQNLYSVEEGLYAGTIFRELDKPFYGPKCYGGIGND